MKDDFFFLFQNGNLKKSKKKRKENLGKGYPLYCRVTPEAHGL